MGGRPQVGGVVPERGGVDAGPGALGPRGQTLNLALETLAETCVERNRILI